MIIFESIRWKNFLSTGDQWTEIELNDVSSSLIVGSNGAGKSTLLDALCFVLFNKPFRKINKPQLVNSINEKGLKVEVCFSIGKDDYRVFRGIKPSLFEVYKNNKLLDQDAATKDTQKYLEQSILKLNFKSFTQVVILGSSTFVPFMQLPAQHRREVIEDLLDINIFSSMNSLLKDRVRETQSRSRDCDHLLKFCSEKVLSQEKLLNSLKEVNSNRLEEKRIKHQQNCDKLIPLVKSRLDKKEELKILEESSISPKEAKATLNSLRQKQSDKKSELKLISKDLNFFQKHDVCPTCDQNIDSTFKESKISKMTAEGKILANEILEFNEKIDESMKIISELEEMSSKLYELRSDINLLDKEIVGIEFDNLKLLDEITNLQEVTPNIDQEQKIYKEVLTEYETTKSQCALVSKTMDEYQVVSNLLKDSGIKSKIIKKYIPIFNKLINKYLQSMDFFVNFTLDEEFNEVIKSRYRDDFSYSSFSEGEKQKIDLALLFTWREIAKMKNSVSTNLLILDEVFDSSLDTSGTAELLQILRNLGKETNVFVISHKGEILTDKFLRTIKFEKVNDFSRMSDES